MTYLADTAFDDGDLEKDILLAREVTHGSGFRVKALVRNSNSESVSDNHFITPERGILPRA